MHTFAPAEESIDTLISQGIAALRAGDKARAYAILAAVVAANPRQEQAWLWLSGVVASDAERYYCLEQVLAINPRNLAAQRGLAMLPRGLAPISPLAEAPPALGQSAPAESGLPQEAGLLASDAALVGSLSFAVQAPSEDWLASSLALDAPAPSDARPAALLAAKPADIDFAIRELGAKRSAGEVSRMLCEQHGYGWDTAQALVTQVEREYQVKIARRQGPLLILLGLATIIGGLLLIGYAALLFSSRTQIHSRYYYRNMVGGFVLGTMMVLGAAIGLAQTIRGMWK